MVILYNAVKVEYMLQEDFKNTTLSKGMKNGLMQGALTSLRS